MSQQTPAYLKTRFQSGDQPTGQDFEDLIDSFVSQADAPAYFNTPGLRVENYGALPGGFIAYDATMEQGSDIVTLVLGRFEEEHEEFKINVWGAGFHLQDDEVTTSVDASGLWGDIVEYISPTQVRMSQVAQRDVSSVPVAWGPATSAGIALAKAAAVPFGGATFVFGSGIYMIDETFDLESNYRIIGEGFDRTTLINVGRRSMFRNAPGNLSHTRFEGLNLINMRGGWNGGRNTIVFGGGSPNYDLRVLDCKFVGDTRTMQISNIQGAWFERCEFAPLTDGVAQVNVTDPATTSRYVWIKKCLFKRTGGSRSTNYMVDGDASTPSSDYLTFQASVNVRASHVHVEDNQFEGPNFAAIFFEGLNQSDCWAVNNEVHCPDGYTANPLFGIDLKIASGAHLLNNKLYGNAYQKATSGAVGIRWFPGESGDQYTYGDLAALNTNTITNFHRPIYIGDSNALTHIGSLDLIGNQIRDAGAEPIFLQFNTANGAGSTVRMLDNRIGLSSAAAGTPCLIRLASSQHLHAFGNVGKNITGPLLSFDVVGTGSFIHAGDNINESGEVWKTTGAGNNLKEYAGTFDARDRIWVGEGQTFDLSDVAATKVIGTVAPGANRVVVKMRFTYTEASDGTAARTITIKSNNNTTLYTYTTKLNQALYFAEEVTFPNLTRVHIPTDESVLTATCDGGGGAGIVKVEIAVMPN